MRIVLIFLAYFASLGLPWLRAAEDALAFVPGRTSDLSCEVVKQEEENGFVRVAVEVRNKSASRCEPLVFSLKVSPKQKKAFEPFSKMIARARFPYAYRHGRSIPPGGKERYELQVGAASAGKIEASVVQANWFTGEVPPKPSISIGAFRQVDQPVQAGGSVAATAVTLENPLPHAVDLVFRAVYKAPTDCVALVGVRLMANAKRDWVIGDIRGDLSYEDAVPYRESKVAKLDLVDWCFVGAGDPKDAESLLRPAYDAWVRWPEPRPTLRGAFEYRLDAMDATLEGSGRFRIAADGEVTVELVTASKAASTVERDAKKAIEKAFADLRRLPFDEVARLNRLSVVGGETVEIDGPGFREKPRDGYDLATTGSDERFVENVTAREGRIVCDGTRDDLEVDEWITQPMEQGYVVVRRAAIDSNWSERYSYGAIAGLVVPLRHVDRIDMPGGGLMRQTSVSFSDIAFDDETASRPPRAPVQGAAAADLKAAWESGFRYPESRRDLRCKFEVRTPGTDHMWAGAKTFAGTLKLGGFRGFLMMGDGWLRAEIDPQGSFSEDLRRTLTYTLSDRLILWMGRDFNGRPPFDEAFAGATIESKVPGVFSINDSTYRTISLTEGRVTKITFADGRSRNLTWSKVGKEMVVTRVQTDGEDLLAKFSWIGDRAVPVELEFRTVFGKDWGPEKFVFKDVKLE